MMSETPFFSIVIPTYNRAEFVVQAAQSLLAQTFGDFEILVVDDGSTDQTEQMIKKNQDKRIVYLKKENGERGAARNTGVRLAKGRYITFLDSDDRTYPNHLSTAFDFISGRNAPEIFHLGYEIMDEKGVLLKKMTRSGNINRELVGGNPLSCIGVFVRKDIMVENFFIEDRDLAGLEDWELWLRIAAQYPIQSCDQITAVMIQHPQRSVLQSSPDRTINKMEKFISYVNRNQDIRKTYHNQLDKISASAKTYTALHLAIPGGNRKLAMRYLVQGVLENPFEILRKRFFVILKLILLG